MTQGRDRSRTARRLALLLLALAIALAAIVAGASAEDTTEGTTFGADGVALTPSLGVHLEETAISSITARPDGGVVARQGAYLDSLLADGAPNPAAPPSPAPKGRTFPAAGGKSFVVSEGKLTRLNSDGTADTTFGGDGSVEVSQAEAVAELASGKIVTFGVEVGGTNRPENTGQVVVLNADGSSVPGATFTVTLPSIAEGMPVEEIVPTPEGGLLIADHDFMLELRADGSPNPGFGHGGLISAGSSISGARILPDGSIEVAGTSYLESEEREAPAIIRLTAAGGREEGFGVKGVNVLVPDRYMVVGVVSWGADGSAVLGGLEMATGCPRKQCEEAPALVGVDPSGNLDAGFGEGGVLRLAALAGRPSKEGYAGAGVIALARRPDGSIVAGGNASPNPSVAFVAALTPRGALVPAFGEGGIVRLSDPEPASLSVSEMVPAGEGKVFAVGSTDVGLAEGAMLIRYGADGSLDPTFGNGSGWVGLAEYGREANAIAIRGGVALVAGYRYLDSKLLMIHADDGSPVTSFGSGGSVDLPEPRDYVGALAFASDGDPVVLDGGQSADDIESFPLQRYRPDGRPDRAFGKGGQVILHVPKGGLRGRVMTTVPGGRVLVGGRVGDRFVVGRLLPDGKLDPRFGSHGWSVTRVPGRAKSMAMVRSGSGILLAGVVGESEEHDLALVRLDSDGQATKGFGRRGIRIAKVQSGWSPSAILPAPAGITVLQSRGVRPVVTFAKDGSVSCRPLAGGAQSAWQVEGAVAGDHLVVGWAPLIFAPGHEVENYYLSSLPLVP